MKRYFKNQKGSSAVIMLLFMTAMLAMMALVTDAGLLYLQKSKLQNAVDAAALAGMSRFRDGTAAVSQAAYDYASLNGLDSMATEVNITPDAKNITVTTRKTQNFFFARIFGVNNSEVTATASAKAGAVAGAKGIRPLAVVQQNFIFGETYTIKKGAGTGYSGNYGALALGGTGAANYLNKLKYGYSPNIALGQFVRVGEDLETEPGNMAGPTYDGISYILRQDTQPYHDINNLEVDCPRVIIIPIIDYLQNGRSEVKVMGFAKFFLEDVTYEGGKTEIKGKFLRTLGEGEISDGASDFGFAAVKLTN